jgi:hypothetical protein
LEILDLIIFQIILDFGPTPKKDETKLERKLSKVMIQVFTTHVYPYTDSLSTQHNSNKAEISPPETITISDNNSGSNNATATMTAARPELSIKEQVYWRKNHPDKFPALAHAIKLFRIYLLTNNPFAGNDTLQEYALTAIEDTFQTFKQFTILHGMVKMVRIISLINHSNCL